MRIWIILLSMIYIQACGTITTLSESDQRISSKLTKQNTYCESLTRVYSGVSYDFCKLNSKPTGTAIDVGVGFYLFDGVLSTATDTLVLPYTIVQQSEKGSMQIVR
jgi:uncharacterized protein YceK